MTRMLGRVARGQCPRCRRPPGLDCPDDSRTTRDVRQAEERRWQREVLEELEQELDEASWDDTPYGQLSPRYWRENGRYGG